MPTITEDQDSDQLSERRELHAAQHLAEWMRAGERQDRVDQAGALIFFMLFAVSVLTTTFVLVKLFGLVMS